MGMPWIDFRENPYTQTMPEISRKHISICLSLLIWTTAPAHANDLEQQVNEYLGNPCSKYGLAQKSICKLIRLPIVLKSAKDYLKDIAHRINKRNLCIVQLLNDTPPSACN